MKNATNTTTTSNEAFDFAAAAAKDLVAKMAAQLERTAGNSDKPSWMEVENALGCLKTIAEAARQMNVINDKAASDIATKICFIENTWDAS